MTRVTYQRIRTNTLGIGLGFLFVGLLGSALFFLATPVETLSYFVLIFPTIGILALLSGGKLIIDPARNKFTIINGIWGGFRKKDYDFSQVKCVQVLKRIYKTDKKSHTEYPVEILLADKNTLLAVQKSNFMKSRRFAEQIAKIIRTDYRDTVSDKVRSFSELDMSLRQRLKLKGASLQPPEDSGIRRIKMERRSGETIFHLAERGFARDFLWELVLTLVIGVSIAIFAGYVVMKTMPEVFWTMSLAIILGPLIKYSKESQKFKISGSNFVIQRVLMGLTRTQTYEIDSIEELVDYQGALVLRSDFREVRFAENINGKERKWLLATICRELVS